MNNKIEPMTAGILRGFLAKYAPAMPFENNLSGGVKAVTQSKDGQSFALGCQNQSASTGINAVNRDAGQSKTDSGGRVPPAQNTRTNAEEANDGAMFNPEASSDEVIDAIPGDDWQDDFVCPGTRMAAGDPGYNPGGHDYGPGDKCRHCGYVQGSDE